MKYFLVSNLVLCLGILLFLRQFRRFHSERHLERRSHFPPLLTDNQDHLLFVGFSVWLVSLAIRLVQAWVSSPSAILFLSFELTFTAATMYIALGLMYFAAFPIREGLPAPSFRHTDVLRRSGLVLLVGISMIAILLGVRDGSVGTLYLWVLPGWQLLMLGHTYYNLRYSAHTLRGAVVFTLVIWGVFSVFARSEYWIIETLLLLSILSFLLRAVFIYISDAHRRTDSFRREKEVMISFLRKVTGAEERLIDTLPEEHQWAGSLNLDRVLRVTLNFALGLTEASAGAIFLLGRLDPREEDQPEAASFLRARVVEGPYPPATDISQLHHVSMRLRYLNDLVLSERIPVDGSLIGRTVMTGETLFLPNALNDPAIPQQTEDFLKIKSLLMVPLRVRGEVVGAVSVVNRRSGTEEFAEEDQRLLEAMAEQAAITIGSAVMHRELQEKDRLEREMELAREVQRLLLPTSVPQIPGYDFSAYSLAARQVGGDYYDFIWMDEKRLALVVADVSGKGVPGALTMAMVRSALRCISAHSSGARDILIRLNEFISLALRRDMFISMLIAVLDTDTLQFEVARAGHDPLIILRAGRDQPELIAPSGIVLGLVGQEDFDAYTKDQIVRLGAGDTVVFYTDGITEAMNPRGEEYSFDRFLRNLIHVRDQDPGNIIEQVSRDVQRFSSGVPQHDDLTMIVMRVRAGRVRETSVGAP